MPETLPDPTTGAPRYRVDRLLHRGRNAELALATDLAREQTQVVLKTIRYDAAWSPQEILERRARVAVEQAVYALGLPGVPGPVERLDLPQPDGDVEPLLIFPYVEAVPLPAWMVRHAPEGLPTARGLGIAMQVARTLDSLHEAGWVLQGLAPEHVLVGENDRVWLVGLGNALKKQGRPTPTKPDGVDPFVAPELERERSGRFIDPRADVYSFGALLAFLFSNEIPTGRPDAPWTRAAIERIGARPEGIGLIVAHCMQPLHKKRMAHMGRLLPWLREDTLPAPTDQGFGEVSLLGLWRPERLADARVGHLSPGPLVDRTLSRDRVSDESASPAVPDAQCAPAPAESARIQEVPDAVTSIESHGLSARARLVLRLVAISLGLLAIWRLFVELTGP